jgi:hypothetical protein
MEPGTDIRAALTLGRALRVSQLAIFDPDLGGIGQSHFQSGKTYERGADRRKMTDCGASRTEIAELSRPIDEPAPISNDVLETKTRRNSGWFRRAPSDILLRQMAQLLGPPESFTSWMYSGATVQSPRAGAERHLVPISVPVAISIPIPISVSAFVPPPGATAPLAELVTLVVGDAGAIAAVGVQVTRIIARDAAASPLVPITESTATCGIPGAGGSVAGAETNAILTPPALLVATVAISLAIPAPSPVPFAPVGATLIASAARIARELAPLAQNVRILRKANFGAGEGNQAESGSRRGPQGAAPVAHPREHSRPVVETAIVH